MHLAITFLRAMNIPARYATGYLGDIGVPISPAAMDFSAWLEVYMGGRWWTVDARHNQRRIGRVFDGSWAGCGRCCDHYRIRRCQPSAICCVD